MSQTASANTCMHALCLQPGIKNFIKFASIFLYTEMTFLYIFLYNTMLKSCKKTGFCCSICKIFPVCDVTTVYSPVISPCRLSVYLHIYPIDMARNQSRLLPLSICNRYIDYKWFTNSYNDYSCNRLQQLLVALVTKKVRFGISQWQGEVMVS